MSDTTGQRRAATFICEVCGEERASSNKPRHMRRHTTKAVIGRRGNQHMPLIPLRERLEAKYFVDDSGCWIWTASYTPGGYGKIWNTEQHRMVSAHIVSYEVFVGPIPEGLTLDHLCRNPACVNPDHLEPVTMRENVLRSPTAPTAINARKTHCIRGHEFAGDNLIVGKDGKRQCRTCRRARDLARYYAKKEASA